MTPTADDMARIIAEFRAQHPRSKKAAGHLCAVAKAKRTQELRDEVRLCHMGEMLARCVEEDIKAFGGECHD
jgi:hypothetical protein